MSWRIAATRGLMRVAPLALVGVCACFDAPVEEPATKVTQQTDVRVQQNIKNKVDILFMIDDSFSMAPKQSELNQRFPELIKILEEFGKTNPAWYHIGVITSDCGAAGSNACPQGTGAGGYGGRCGILQPIGAASTGCMGPQGGVRFIDYNQLDNTSNLPPGQKLEDTFRCMSNVGVGGCGYEHQLESVYQALHTRPPENHDFLRDDALLVVVWVTDEDDCSAPRDTDLFDGARSEVPPKGYGAPFSYRCTEFGIACIDPKDGQLKQLPYGDSGGVWDGCMSLAPERGGKLVDVQKYINLFKQGRNSGGLKDDPNDVILVGITGPSGGGASSLIANPIPMPPGPYVPCQGPLGKTCAVVLQHSCGVDSDFSGDPAVRINQVISSVANNQQTSICDTSYASALQNLGKLIVSTIGAGCISSPFDHSDDPDCVVEDVSTSGEETKVAEIPRCDRVPASTFPCWRLESKPVCDAAGSTPGCCPAVCAGDGEPGQHFGVTIDRGPGGMPPPSTTARVACSTLAVAKNPHTGQLPVCGAPLP